MRTEALDLVPDGVRATPRPRLPWPDVAKGACILLVVLHHVIGKHVDPMALVAPAAVEPVLAAWYDLTYALKPVRMPLFFLISGFLAVGTLARPWPAAVLRLASPAYLYVAWLAVLSAVLLLTPALPTNRVTSLAELATDLLLPSTALWFLWALAAYLLVARVTRGLPTWVVVGAAGTLTVVAGALPIGATNREAALAHLVFFLVGVRAPDLVRRLAERPVPLPAALGAYAAAVAVVELAGVPRGPVLLLLAVLGLPLGLSASARLGGLGVGRWLGWLGRRTLPVYLLHLPVIGVLVQLSPPAPLPVAGPVAPGGALGAVGVGDVVAVAVAVVYPLLVTLLVCAASLLVHHLLRRAGLGWLFALPAPLRRALGSVPRPPTGAASRVEDPAPRRADLH